MTTILFSSDSHPASFLTRAEQILTHPLEFFLLESLLPRSDNGRNNCMEQDHLLLVFQLWNKAWHLLWHPLLSQ